MSTPTVPATPSALVERPEGEGDEGDPADAHRRGDHPGDRPGVPVHLSVRHREGRRDGRADCQEAGLEPAHVRDQSERGDGAARGEQHLDAVPERRDARPVAGDRDGTGGEDDGGAPGQGHAPLPLPSVGQTESQGGHAQQRGEDGGEEQGGGGGSDPVEHGYKLVINVPIWYE
ncbi:hypothetical protein QFZ56_004150 [Streptomyces achromogenes]|uniref:Uncharacterized protein n=1 Tax=Streptomyces achromogenes TaxID=67255 RepID=A0ABU0Q3E6_STRAH|nr:hypothetical protein [Streptomyces achromogenes]